MRIIPAIDIIEGKCVRLTQGNYSTKKIYNEDPLEVARHFEANGMKHLHLVDLDGARSGTIVNCKVLERIAKNTSLHIDFGGGIKSLETVEAAFNAGAGQVTVGTIAATQPEEFLNWLNKYGAQRLILGADCIRGKMATHGWLDTSAIDIIPFLQQHVKNGVLYATVTDIEKDGLLSGPSFGLYKEIMETVPMKLIASGGVTTISDVMQLSVLGCEAVIIGKAIYEGTMTLDELSKLC